MTTRTKSAPKKRAVKKTPKRATPKPKTATPVEPPVIPWHQWTNGGEHVLVVRFCARDGASSRGFRYPLEVGATAEAADWNPEPVCGDGLHGWPWGFAIGDGSDPDWSALWQVYAVLPADVVSIDGGKVKFRRGRLVFSGEWFGALAHVAAGRQAWIVQAAAASTATGYQAASTATGDQAASTATGDRAASTATGDQAASSGQRAAVVTGLGGRARSGKGGCIALAYCPVPGSPSCGCAECHAGHVHEMRCAETGTERPGALKANVWYELDATGTFVEAEEPKP